MQCVTCGSYCVEGRVICWSCEQSIHEEKYDENGEELVTYTTDTSEK